MGVLILTGPPGVGKTTVARLLAERSELGVHLEVDYFFFFIRSGFIEPWDPESEAQNGVAMRAAAAAAREYAEAGYTTIFDGIVIPRWTLIPVRDALQAAGLQVAYAVLRAPQPECLARFQQREGSPEALDPQILARIGGEFDDLEAFEPHAIEVSGMTPEQTADAVAARLASGSLDL